MADGDNYQESVAALSQKFTPLSKSQEKMSSEEIRHQLSDILRPSAKGSAFIRLVDATPFPKNIPKRPPPPPPKQTVLNMLALGKTSSVDLLIEEMKLTEEERTIIQEATLTQANSESWKQQREGRITASNFKRADAAGRNEKCSDTFIAQVMGYSTFHPTTAMKHGVSMEPHAKKLYSNLKRKTHKKFQVHDAGLSIDNTHPFIAASPDLIVSCRCHGKGLCEIKCPYIVRNKAPIHWEHIESGHLSRKSPYFFQIQGQMEVTGLSYCDLFVYTAHGYHQERVPYDEEFAKTLKVNLINFWRKFIGPELISSRVFAEAYAIDNQLSDHTYVCSSTSAGVKEVPPIPSTSKGPLKESPFRKVYLCAVCGKDVSEEPSIYAEYSVECSDCKMWVHFPCGGIAEGAEPMSDEWLCVNCKVL